MKPNTSRFTLKCLLRALYIIRHPVDPDSLKVGVSGLVMTTAQQPQLQANLNNTLTSGSAVVSPVAVQFGVVISGIIPTSGGVTSGIAPINGMTTSGLTPGFVIGFGP